MRGQLCRLAEKNKVQLRFSFSMDYAAGYENLEQKNNVLNFLLFVFTQKTAHREYAYWDGR